jgi:hypothetical protein
MLPSQHVRQEILMMVSFAGFLMMLIGSGASDLLDVLHTESYWKAKQVTVSVEQLITDATAAKPAADAGAAADAPATAASVRRLMAIRTLGERKEAQASAALQSLLDSKEPFVADYAKAALAAIQGRPAGRAAASAEARMADVWLLPSQVDLVAQATPAGKPLSGGDVLGDVPLPPGMNKAELLEKMTSDLLPVVEAVGNVRLAALTVGFYANAPNEPGYAVIVARGQYDSKAAAAALGQHQVPTTTIDGVDIFQPDKSAAVILASDTRAVLVTGDANGKLPLEEVVSSIKKDAGNLHDNTEISKLIGQTDTTQPIWAVAKMTDGLRQVMPPLAAFDIATLVLSQRDDVLSLSLQAEGSDAEKVKMAVEEANAHLQEGITQLRQAVQNLPAVKSLLEAMESVKLSSDGGKATATGSLKGLTSLPLMLFGVRAEATVGPAKGGL